MTDEVLGTRLETELLIYSLHWVLVEVDTFKQPSTQILISGNVILTLVSSRILVLPSLQKLKELLRPTLLKETHQRALDSFHLSAGDFGDPAIPIHITSRDLLELEVASDIGVNEDLGELARCDDKLGDKVDSVVTIPTEFGGRCGIGPELTIQLRCDEGGGMRNGCVVELGYNGPV